MADKSAKVRFRELLTRPLTLSRHSPDSEDTARVLNVDDAKREAMIVNAIIAMIASEYDLFFIRLV